MEPMAVAVADRSKLSEKQLIVSWPGHQVTIPLTKPVVHLGRTSNGNDIVVHYPVVSRYHATLKLENGSYTLLDGQTRDGEYRPSSNGLYLRGQRIKEHKLSSGDIIQIPDRNENFITLLYFDAATPPLAPPERVRLDYEISLGRDKQNDVVLDDPTVAAFHAIISPVGQGHALRDLGSSSGVYVNGQRIQQVTLKPNDLIRLGAAQLRYDGLALVSLDLRYPGIRLAAFNIHKQVKVKKEKPADSGYKVLLNNVSLAIQPREFVAIVGGSGAGKSTLLDALNGFRPAEGQVLINGDNLYQNFDLYRRSIGYVPQDDIIHRELTVAEALRYVARLRLPADTPDKDIEERIDYVLAQVAMSDKKILLVKQLSGGQRKRVSIAVELIADPGIIFLDEPTSGLDPGLDKKMMFTLKQVAQAGKTVILVTHATGNITECDLVAFFAAGGSLVFYGPPKDALTFFEVSDFAEIYNKVEQEPDRWFEAFESSTYHDLYVKKRLGPVCPGCSRPLKKEQAKFCDHCGYNLAEAQPADQEQKSPARQRRTSLWQKLTTSLSQMTILTRRNLTLLVRDRRNFFFLLLQAPVIALLLFLVMEPGQFGKGISAEAADLAGIQKTLFVLACIATWFGLINAVREIVKELPIYRRERLVNLSISAYVGSKLLVLLGLSTVQTFMLALIVGWRAGFPWAGSTFLPGPLEIFATLLLVTFTAACFGLFLSAVMSREDRVMSVMPLFLIPQIVFAGIVFTLEGGARWVSWLTFSRWGVEALGSTVNLPELRKVASYSVPVDELPFVFAHTPAYLLQNWAILAGFALLSIVLTVFALRRQDVI